MNNYLLLGACFLLGILLRRLGRLPDNAAASLNGFVVHISLPALKLAGGLILLLFALGMVMGDDQNGLGSEGDP